MSSVFRTEYEFELPKGYVDPEGTCHKKGMMRLAKASDEILPSQDPRVISNPAYITIIILSRVITKLGGLDSDKINPKLIENLFLSDLNYLKILYQKINLDESFQATCPKCQNTFDVEIPQMD